MGWACGRRVVDKVAAAALLHGWLLLRELRAAISFATALYISSCMQDGWMTAGAGCRLWDLRPSSHWGQPSSSSSRSSPPPENETFPTVRFNIVSLIASEA
ncbi:hypothetical protein BZA05DRAFT_254010 [Tricharina praecox]|uniref:uncharacterized protein n=1 Tax=Tricharina praecox TaxID=43433 RepID=UPI00221FB2C5|nr:uncharacterized protein BZA05DRAFT_254010 [Tricharina praecox]KAI5854942.1 hypothetical protein BZA05DRAFT_254010 [Tricharina praecox]